MPNAESSSENIEAVIRQAERMQHQLQLESQYKKNMAYFKKISPKIYETYKDYKPNKHQLHIDSHNKINLINIGSKKPAYFKDPKSFAQEQIEEYFKNPKQLHTIFSCSAEWNPRHIHVKSVNKLITQFKSLNIDNNRVQNKKIGLLVMTGCGLGHQIIDIMNKTDVQNIIIYDSEKDSFYSSLHMEKLN